MIDGEGYGCGVCDWRLRESSWWCTLLAQRSPNGGLNTDSSVFGCEGRESEMPSLG